MNWRWAILGAAVFAVVEAIAAVAAYDSATWNFGHTEVLYRWDAVREVCLMFMPPMMVAVLLLAVLARVAAHWATRD